MVRAKFMVTKVAKNYHRDYSNNQVTDGGQAEIHLHPQYDTSIPEDQRFAQATPTGEITLWVNNPAAIEYLKPGHQFYVDFTEVPEPEAPAASS